MSKEAYIACPYCRNIITVSGMKNRIFCSACGTEIEIDYNAEKLKYWPNKETKKVSEGETTHLLMKKPARRNAGLTALLMIIWAVSLFFVFAGTQLHTYNDLAVPFGVILLADLVVGLIAFTIILKRD